MLPNNPLFSRTAVNSASGVKTPMGGRERLENLSIACFLFLDLLGMSLGVISILEC